jgi:hypothetical protein
MDLVSFLHAEHCVVYGTNNHLGISAYRHTEQHGLHSCTWSQYFAASATPPDHNINTRRSHGVAAMLRAGEALEYGST